MATYIDGMDGGKHNSDNTETSITKKQTYTTQQTAVEWLKKELEEYGSSSHLNLDWETFDELCEQAKQMEKEQIMNAVYDSMGTNFDPNMGRAQQYYNEKYGK
jgi:hypothetical protein